MITIKTQKEKLSFWECDDPLRADQYKEWVVWELPRGDNFSKNLKPLMIENHKNDRLNQKFFIKENGEILDLRTEAIPPVVGVLIRNFVERLIK